VIRHLLVFNFAAHVDADERAAILRELDELPAHFPAMRCWSRGANISRRDQTYEHAFVVDFATEDELLAYLDSEHHERFVAERWKPNVHERAIVSFEYG
jgi:2,3-dihydroxy-p-cumate/2,3-dihydroxybenzoate 3,4-dioxygenase